MATCALTLMLLGSAGGAAAYDGYGGGYSDGGGDGWGGYGDRGGRAASYINPDTGAATANPDVDPNSGCYRPDQYDVQMVSPVGATTNNVHNDACFLDDRGNKVDGPATFESTGVGIISACPDPDNLGSKVAIISADKKRCFQSGYQQKGTAGDLEFHARLNSTTPGTQTVVWCADANRNGCGDEWNKSTITIKWVTTR